MNSHSRLALILAPLLLVACSKKEVTAPAAVVVPVAVPAAAPVPTSVATPAPAAVDPLNMTDEQKALAKKQKALDFGTMEDKYLNDPLAQWSTSATASSSASDSTSHEPYESRLPKWMTGPVDGKYWQNKNRDIGFEWVQLEYAKPVNATEVRLVIDGGSGVEALNKIELQDNEGKWHTVWSGISDAKRDERGERTWFVKTFPKTTYKVKAVKYTVANNVSIGDKDFDAAQLIGE
ncbi:MAG: hypothetical protein H7176_14550 [Bdellovibrionales bacterium]|nr:hypothetical protein [Massilia sp.]